MRRCTRCGIEKPLNEFPPVRRGQPKLQSWCRACFAENNARYYRENHDAQKARLLKNSKIRREEVRAQLVAYLSNHPCVDCGKLDIVVLEFDHVSGKSADISRYANGGRAWATIEAEIAKCEVRCANCHRRKTEARRGPRRISLADPVARASPVQLLLDGALGLRQCRVCRITKALTEFPFRSIKKQTRQKICLACQRAYSARWYRENADRHAANVRVT